MSVPRQRADRKLWGPRASTAEAKRRKYPGKYLGNRGRWVASSGERKKRRRRKGNSPIEVDESNDTLLENKGENEQEDYGLTTLTTKLRIGSDLLQMLLRNKVESVCDRK